jgi:hypothetical protein
MFNFKNISLNIGESIISKNLMLILTNYSQLFFKFNDCRPYVLGKNSTDSEF